MAAGRKVGTDKEFVLQSKVIREFLETKKWIIGNVENARDVLQELLLNKKTSPSIRRGIAEFMLSENSKYYKEQGGVAKRNIPKTKDKKENFISLKFDGTDG